MLALLNDPSVFAAVCELVASDVWEEASRQSEGAEPRQWTRYIYAGARKLRGHEADVEAEIVCGDHDALDSCSHITRDFLPSRSFLDVGCPDPMDVRAADIAIRVHKRAVFIEDSNLRFDPNDGHLDNAIA